MSSKLSNDDYYYIQYGVYSPKNDLSKRNSSGVLPAIKHEHWMEELYSSKIRARQVMPMDSMFFGSLEGDGFD